VEECTFVPFRRFWGDVGREFMQGLSAARHGTLGSYLRLGMDGILDGLRVYVAVVSGIFRIRGLRKHHEIRRYNLDDIIDP
jgi:hypothetical protein